MIARSMLGHRIRRLRHAQGTSQIKLAERLGVSPSYLNLIEHNRRAVPLRLMVRLSEIFGIELDEFAEQDDARVLADMNEVVADPLFADHDISRADVEFLVGHSTAMCQAVSALYRAYKETRDSSQALAERMSDETFLSTSGHELRTLLTSIRSFSEILLDNVDLAVDRRTEFLGIIVDETERLSGVVGRMLEFVDGEDLRRLIGGTSSLEQVVDFIEDNQNHFPAVEEAAEDLRGRVQIEESGRRQALERILREEHGYTVDVSPAQGSGAALVTFDEKSRRLRVPDALSSSSVDFQLAYRLGLLQPDSLFESFLSQTALTGPQARSLCRDALAKYFAAAVLMPYGGFLDAARAVRYDIELLQNQFAVSFEQVCHRLTTLQQPGNRGVPMHLVRVDIAGNISKRYGGSGMRIPRFGGACPRWNVHAAFMSPGTIISELAEMPDGRAYLCIARAMTRRAPDRRAPSSYHAVAIGCEISHADQLVYADGMDLSRPTYVPIGPNCRLCERQDCGQRAFPSLLTRSGAGDATVAGAT